MASKITSIKPSITTIIDTRIGSSPNTERIRGGRLSKIRQRIALRDQFACQICGRLTLKGEVDHIVPLFLGGSNADANMQWLDKECHKAKSEREEGERG